jgi:hypothetical protein
LPSTVVTDDVLSSMAVGSGCAGALESATATP